MLAYLVISAAERASRSVTFVSLRDTQFTVVLGTWQRLNGDGRIIVLADAGECVERFLAAVRWGGEHLFQPAKEKEEDI